MRPRKTIVKERPLPLTILGAGRGAREALPTLIELSAMTPLAPLFLDAAPGQALALADDAKRQGLAATALEGRVEDLINTLPREHLERVINNLDRGAPVATAVERTTPGHDMVYQIVKPALGNSMGLRGYLPPDDPVRRLEMALLFRTFDTYTLPRGSQALIGSEGAYEDHIGEPLLRSWMAEHTRDVLRKTIANLPPDVAPLEITDDFGATTMPAYICGGVAFSDPEDLARRIVEQPTQPLLRGQHLMLIEMVPALGIRWHKACLKVNGRLTIERAATHERQPAAQREGHESLVEGVTTALTRAQRNEVVATNPMFTTD